MSLKANELARRDPGAVECRADALRVNWTFVDLATADAHSIDCRFSCSIRIADNPADRRMFAEVFLAARESVTTETIAEHFGRVIRSALTTLAAEQKVTDVIGHQQSTAWAGALMKAANPVAFAAGLELLPPFQLDVESATLQRERLEEIARARAEHRSAGQLQHLQHATELLKQFQTMRQSSPELSAGKLLEQLNPADRGAALQAMLQASSNETTRSPLWAVAGSSLVKIDTRTVPPRMQPYELPATLGPLRSVRSATIDGQKRLLIGVRSGVMVASADDPTEVQCYPVPGMESPLGFNRVVCNSREIWASHGEAGIVGWKLGEPSAPLAIYRERAPVTATTQSASILASVSSSSSTGTGATHAAGPRNLLLLKEATLVYSVGPELIIRSGDARTSLPAQSQSEIIAIVPALRTVVAIHQDGTLVIVDRSSRQIADVRRRGRRLSAAAVMPWLGDIRLLLAADQGPIDCVGLDDPLVTEYLSPYRGLKMLTATGNLIAAVSPDRQRIIVWNNWDGQRPVGEIHVTSQVKHRIADIEFQST